MASRVSQNRAAKSQAILDASERLFAANGFHATRMSDVALELGLHKASLYHYFDSKESILVELIKQRVGAAVDSLEEIAGSPGPVRERLAAAVRSHIETFHQNADLYTIFQSERLHTVSDEAAELVNAPGRRYEDLFVSLVRSGIETGELSDELDPHLTMKAIVGLCNSTLSWFRPGGRLTIDQLADRYVEMALRIVGAVS